MSDTPRLLVEGAPLPAYVVAVATFWKPCKGPVCQEQRLLWVKTNRAKHMPLELHEGKWIAHHARCPDAARYRRDRR